MQDLTKDATIAYDVTMETIAIYADSAAGLEATTKEGYKLVKSTIADCRGMRGQIEKTRKTLKADALTYGRAVDGAARVLREAIEEIEHPLKALKAEVDDAKELERQRKKDEAAAKVEAELQAEREAEQARIAEEMAELRRQQAESDRIAAEATERAAAAELLLEQEREQSKRLKDEAAAEAQRKLDEERERRESQEAADAARLAAEKAEREAAEAEAREVKEAAERALRIEAMRPDAEKLAAYADALLAVERPELDTPEGEDALAAAVLSLHSIVTMITDPKEQA